jgi:hypothetical protein
MVRYLAQLPLLLVGPLLLVEPGAVASGRLPLAALTAPQPA